MPSPAANPTPLTPPRVPFIDQRTGLIDRAWYQFFLSLYRTSENVIDDVTAGTDVNSLLASYDAALRNAEQYTETLPPSADCCDEVAQVKQAASVVPQAETVDAVSELAKQVDALAQQVSSLSTLAAVAELGKQVDGLAQLPPPREFKRARYGQFYDTTTQIPAAIDTPYAITFNTIDVSYGVTIGSPTSRVYVDEAAVYNFLFSIQLDKTSGGTANFWVWPRINGTDVPNSNSQIRIQGNDAEQLVTVGYFFQLNAGDYVEIMYAVSDVSVQVQYFAASAFYPAIPSIILTVSNNIKGVQ